MIINKRFIIVKVGFDVVAKTGGYVPSTAIIIGSDVEDITNYLRIKVGRNIKINSVSNLGEINALSDNFLRYLENKFKDAMKKVEEKNKPKRGRPPKEKTGN
ncbi:MAG: hypothetical protein ACOC56_00325 [Atribacterota bacterium]